MQLENSAIISRNNNLLSTKIDGEMAMMSIENNAYYSLNSVAVDIWELIETPISLDNIVSKLVNKYEVEPDTCKKEVSELIQELVAQKLVNVDY